MARSKDPVKMFCRTSGCTASIDITGVADDEIDRHARYYNWMRAPVEKKRWTNPMASNFICEKCVAKLDEEQD